MPHDVFISYSKTDKVTADAICKALEANGISCWYTPRNVPSGADWDDSIMAALGASRVMILVLSSQSDKSIQVKREVRIALDVHRLTVIPFRIESIETSHLRYYLHGIQWLDASPETMAENLERLVEQVKLVIPVTEEGSETAEVVSNAEYVDTLIANTGESWTTSDRDALLRALSNGTMTRATLSQHLEDKKSLRAKAALAKQEQAQAEVRRRLQEERKAELENRRRLETEERERAEADAARKLAEEQEAARVAEKRRKREQDKQAHQKADAARKAQAQAALIAEYQRQREPEKKGPGHLKDQAPFSPSAGPKRAALALVEEEGGCVFVGSLLFLMLVMIVAVVRGC